ncbi:MAG: sigma-70 family RNA polymerase sigma factor [Spirosomataceae bacterium]
MKENTLEPSLWISRYADAMLNFAFRRTSDLTLSEDLVQETFLSALKARDNFKGNSQEKTWLYAILENKITDHFRSSNYRFQKQKLAIDEVFFSHYFESKEQGGHWHEDQKPKNWENLAEDDPTTDGEALSNAIENCLKKLPQKLARIFILKHVEAYNSEKICKELDITSSNYWVMIHRAKLQLRACLETNWFEL